MGGSQSPRDLISRVGPNRQLKSPASCASGAITMTVRPPQAGRRQQAHVQSVIEEYNPDGRYQHAHGHDEEQHQGGPSYASDNFHTSDHMTRGEPGTANQAHESHALRSFPAGLPRRRRCSRCSWQTQKSHVIDSAGTRVEVGASIFSCHRTRLTSYTCFRDPSGQVRIRDPPMRRPILTAVPIIAPRLSL